MVTCASGKSSFTACARGARWVAQDVDAFGIALGDDLYLRVALHAVAEVDELAVDLAGERGAREPRADGGRDLGYGDGPKRLRRAVGETDIQHASESLHTSMMKLPLSLAINPYDHARDLSVDGIELTARARDRGDLFPLHTPSRMGRIEMSFGKVISLMSASEAGNHLPAGFPFARVPPFRDLCRERESKPKDLEGKRVGIPGMGADRRHLRARHAAARLRRRARAHPVVSRRAYERPGA